jgi:hypothetical protein
MSEGDLDPNKPNKNIINQILLMVGGQIKIQTYITFCRFISDK